MVRTGSKNEDCIAAVPELFAPDYPNNINKINSNATNKCRSYEIYTTHKNVHIEESQADVNMGNYHSFVIFLTPFVMNLFDNIFGISLEDNLLFKGVSFLFGMLYCK